MHKARIAAATLTLAAGLLVAPALTQTAAAKTVSNTKVGTISGAYKPYPLRDYVGHFHPAAVEGGRCVRVERKNSIGTWSTGSVYNPTNCNPSLNDVWQITLDSAVSDTYGVRLFVYDGINTGSYVVLCGSKDICLAMR